jgi:TRAP transporter 4TM/12TM fusion protein
MDEINWEAGEKDTRLRDFLGITAIVGIGWCLFQVYAAAVSVFDIFVMRPMHVVFALLLTFVSFSFLKRGAGKRTVFDFLFAGLSAFIGIYVLWNLETIATRIQFVDTLTPLDLFVGTSAIVLILEACRRTIGMALPIICLVFIAYGFLGPYFPGQLSHRGISFPNFIDMQFFTTQGIFSSPIGVSAEIVFYFVLFGVLLEASGGGQLFIDMAYSVTGRARGGAAKASVISSALFGTISGSAVANVVVDGIFTIPLMKKTGYSPSFAASVEAVASTGGQIMPPVMGAAAFLMADIIGVPYSKIILHAAIPAILYYIALYAMVDFEAVKRGIKAVPKEDLPDVKKGLKLRIHLLVPIGVLIYFILADYSLMTATFRAMIFIVVVAMLRKATWMNVPKILGAFTRGAKEALGIAIPSAVAGIMVGVIVYSGLGLKFTGFLVELSKGNLLLALFFVMVACIILGMGMPTSAAYLIGAVLMAPALVNMGLSVIAAHMFVFYFAVISMITPPVALATYAAAAIARTDIWETGFVGFRLALAGFLVPYAFAYNNGLLGMGSLFEIIWVTTTAILGVILLASAIIGFFMTTMTKLERILFFSASILLIDPGKITDLIGLGIAILAIAIQKTRKTQRITSP